MKPFAVIAILAIAAPALAPALAQDTPGVRQVAPGVLEIDGAKVPAVKVDVAALQAAVAESRKFATAKKLLGGNGIANVGPGGSTVHIYKVEDTANGQNKVVVVFEKDGAVLNLSVY